MRTDSSTSRASGTPRATDATQVRDAGLRLTRRVQGWIAAGAVAMAGVLGAVTAHAYHARAAATVTTAPAAQVPADDAGSSGATTPAAPIQPPTAAPVPAPSTNVAPVVSGGS